MPLLGGAMLGGCGYGGAMLGGLMSMKKRLKIGKAVKRAIKLRNLIIGLGCGKRGRRAATKFRNRLSHRSAMGLRKFFNKHCGTKLKTRTSKRKRRSDYGKKHRRS